MFDEVPNATLILKGELNVDVNEVKPSNNIIIDIIIATVFNIESRAVIVDSKCNYLQNLALTLSWRRSLSYWNQSIDLLYKQWTVFYMIETSVMKKLIGNCFT